MDAHTLPASPSPLLLSSSASVNELRYALNCANHSIADFDETSRQWTAYHINGKHPIVGQAWQDHLDFAQRHGAAVRGLRGLKNSIQKELGWLEKSVEEDAVTTHSGASSNASFLCALWHHALYSAVNEGPLVALDASFPLARRDATTDDARVPASRTEKAAKVDIVCDGGKTWIRVASIKPSSLLAEFRQAESYIPGDDYSDDDHSEDDDDNDEAAAKIRGGARPESSRADMEAQLEAHTLDAAARNCSIIRLAEELCSARREHDQKAVHGTTKVQLVLSRLSLRDPSQNLDSKFYDNAEQRRFEQRLKAIAHELEKLDVCLVAAEKRTFSDGTLPRIAELPPAKQWSPTTTLNLDLSALVALVSSVSHMPFPDRIEDADAQFSRVHWKQTESNAEVVGEQSNHTDESGGSTTLPKGSDEGSTMQHARALSEQLRREMSGETFFEALIDHIPVGCGKLQLTCTREAREKMLDILMLVGGQTEQRRMHNIFDENEVEANKLWLGSRWAGKGPRECRVRQSIVLPVKVIDDPAIEKSSVSSAASPVFAGDFAQGAIGSICDAIDVISGNNRDSVSNRVGIHRQTRHTLTSMLLGLVQGHTTITTNINSVKWLVKDIAVAQGLRGDVAGYAAENGGNARGADQPAGVGIAAMWVTYPRSLAEKMTLPKEDLSDSQGELSGSTTIAMPFQALNAASNDRSLEKSPFTTYKSQNNSTIGDSDKGDYKSRCPAERSTSSSGSDAVPPVPLVWQDTPSHRSLSGRRRLARPLRALGRWLKGPRPRSTLEIKHYKWWPLEGVERGWMRLTRPLAWKDPYREMQSHGSFSSPSGHDVEYQGSERKYRERRAELEDDEPWCAGVKRDIKINWLHWTILVLTYIAWILGFAFLVKNLWYEAAIIGPDGQSNQSPSFFGCTTTLWSDNSQCGLNGLECAPFSSNTSLSFRCPSNCQETTLGGTRAVGDQLPSFVPLVVGGGSFNNASSGTLSPSSYVYRGDSFICSAAIHAGVLPRSQGGCSSLWVTGAYSGFEAIDRNGIQSTAFNSTFPLSFVFDTSVRGKDCTDRRSGGYVLDVILLAFVGFVLQPKPLVYLFTLVCVGFWHINFISEPREYPMSVGDPMGDFLPTLFIAYILWRLNFRFMWPAFACMPIEFNVWLQGFFWLGTLLGVVFVNLPLQRLVLSDIQSQPGALTSLIVIIVVVAILAVNQVRVIRKVGLLPKYLSLAIVGAIIVGLLAAIPTTGFRLHHYIVALVLLPFCAFETRLSLMYSAFLLGMFLNGAGRWGYDGIIQDVSVIVGLGISGTSLPSFAAASNWTGIAPYSSLNGSNDPDSAGLVHWSPLNGTAAQSYDSFQLLIDDVLRLQSTATFFNLTLLPLYYLGSAAVAVGTNVTSNPTGSATPSSDISDALLSSTQTNLTFYPGGDGEANLVETLAQQPHYLRLAYYDSNSGSVGDFTKAATVYFNGTFIAPEDGAT